jgi:hypothetical protein
LHASNNDDLGGNRRMIVINGQPENLHSAWDSGIIRARGTSVEGLVTMANGWLLRQDEAQFASGSYVDWANEGSHLAQTVVYPQIEHDNTLDSARLASDITIIEHQIARAGVRLAAVLNRSLRED